MRIRLILSLVVIMLPGPLAYAQAPGQANPSLIRGGGVAGTGLGVNAGAAGAQTTSPLANRARAPSVITGTGHIGAGTGGLTNSLGNPTGGINNLAFGSPVGGINDTFAWGSGTGGVNGVGRGLGAGSGGVLDSDFQGIGIKTGGINATAIGAGTGGLNDQNSLGANSGGINDNNRPRYRVKYFNRVVTAR